MHQVWFSGLNGRRKAEAKHHSGTSDSENTDDEELQATLPHQRQRTSPNVAVVPAPHPSNNNSEPIPANQLSTPREHAEPVRDGDTPPHQCFTTAPVQLAKKLQNNSA